MIPPEEGKGVDGCGTGGVGAAIAMDEVRVGNVDGFLGWREANTVGATETIGDDADVACLGHKSIYLLR